MPPKQQKGHHPKDEKMSNANNKGNGLTGLLTTLAGSGDNWVKLIIVGGLFYNTVVTQKNSGKLTTQSTEIQSNQHGIDTNSAELQRFRNKAAQQLKVIFDNQKVWADAIDETRQGLDKIQTKLGIEHPPFYPYHRQEVPNYESNN